MNPFLSGLIVGLSFAIILALSACAGLRWWSSRSSAQLPEYRRTDLSQTIVDPEAHPIRARRPKGRARVTVAHFSQPRSHWNTDSRES